MSTVASACPLDCPDACSLDVTVSDGRVTTISGNRVNAFTDGFICAKVRRYPEHVYGPDRLMAPGIRAGAKGEGAFRPATWDEALDRVARRLAETRDRFGGEAILPYSYGGSNGYLTQDTVDARLFHRLGASVLERTVCAAPTATAAMGLYGKMPGVALTDYVEARLIVVWGFNPSVSGIHLLPHIYRAQERGARVVVVDPRETPLARRADLHLAVRPGTDLPLALSVIRWLFDSGRADEPFLSEHATGAEALRERAARWTAEAASRECGVPAESIERFARLYADSSPAVIRCGWGLERNRNGGSAAAAVLALPAVAGKFGVRGGGYTMSNSAAWRFDSLDASRTEPPETRRINMNHLGRALAADFTPPIRALFVYNSNAAMTSPRQDRILEGLRREDLFTVVFDAVMTDTARYADVVLPATTFLEHRELSRGYGAFVLQQALPAIDPVGQARPNYAVFAELCRRTGVARPGEPETPEEIQRAILASSARAEELQRDLDAGRAPGPDSGSAPIQFVDVFPRTSDRKAHLAPDELDRAAPHGLYTYQPDPGSARFPLALITPSSDEMISSTLGELVSGLADLEIHPDDAGARGIANGSVIRVFNAFGEVVCPARVTREVRPGVVRLPKGLWSRHTKNGTTSNTLCPDDLTDLGGGACFNDARVDVAPIPRPDAPPVQ